MKCDMSLLDAVFRLYDVGFRLITCSMVMFGVDKSQVVDHSGAHLYTQEKLCSLFGFLPLVCGCNNTKNRPCTSASGR